MPNHNPNQEYCKSHAPDNYVNVKSKSCLLHNCNIVPSYGKEGTKVAEYCKSHAPNNYVNVRNKSCATNLHLA